MPGFASTEASWLCCDFNRVSLSSSCCLCDESRSHLPSATLPPPSFFSPAA